MPDASLGRLRLVAQGLIDRPYDTATDAVTAFGVMQGQELPGVISSAALRSTGRAEDVIEALNARRLVRGYPMRGTVFLMPAADAAWMTDLCAGPARRAQVARQHQLDLDHDTCERALHLTLAFLGEEARPRSEIFTHLEGHGIGTATGRGYHLLTGMVQDGHLVYGPWDDGDHLVAAASTWLPAGSDLAGRFDGERVPAVAEFMLRYFITHGPATIRDFAWWTKLALKEIRQALPLITDQLETDAAPEPSYWAPDLRDRAAELGRAASSPLLLPGFDEFILGYQDRTFAMSPEEHQRIVPGNNGVFKPSVVAGGLVKGVWRRGGRPGKRSMEMTEFTGLSATQRARVARLFEDFPFPLP